MKMQDAQATLLEGVIDLARRAGEVVMAVYATDFAVRGKEDASPVTEADERAERVIVPGLERLLPGVVVVAEEGVAARGAPTVGERFWLVVPLDGTREYGEGRSDWAVHVALAIDGVATIAVAKLAAAHENWLPAFMAGEL